MTLSPMRSPVPKQIPPAFDTVIPLIRQRLAGILIDWRVAVAADIAADNSHGRSVAVSRLDYVDRLDNAVRRLAPQTLASCAPTWAADAAASVHDPATTRRPDVCRICALLEFVLEHPQDPNPPASLTRRAAAPPQSSSWDLEAAERLPRLRDSFCRTAVQAAIHGSPQFERARRVLASTEERLLRDHLDLVLTQVGRWERVEKSWLANDDQLHHDCHHCANPQLNRK